MDERRGSISIRLADLCTAIDDGHVASRLDRGRWYILKEREVARFVVRARQTRIKRHEVGVAH